MEHDGWPCNKSTEAVVMKTIAYKYCLQRSDKLYLSRLTLTSYSWTNSLAHAWKTTSAAEAEELRNTLSYPLKVVKL